MRKRYGARLGFIDVQINGGGGILFNDEPTVNSLRIISKAHEKFGVLNFCPTIISTDMNTIKCGLKAIQNAVNRNIDVIGAHIEGPFIDLTKAGIHEKNYIHKASDDELKDIIATSNGCASIITIAPESVNPQQIELLVLAGIKVFIGHSNATSKKTLEVAEHGVVGVTHLFNAMSQFESREPGVVGATFLSDNLFAGIIVDGHHVDYQSVIIAKKLKKEKLFLVTDSMPPQGKRMKRLEKR